MSNKGELNESNWEDPISFRSGDLPPFPLDIFPQWIRDYVDALSKQLQVPIDMPAMMVLTILSTALTRKYKFYLEETDWLIDLNTYILVPASSGSNKTAVEQHVKRPIEEFEKKLKSTTAKNQIQYQNEYEVKQKRIEKLALRLANKKVDSELIKEREQLIREASELRKKLTVPRVAISGNITQEKLFSFLIDNNETLAIITDEFNELLDIITGKYSKKLDLNLLLKAYNGSPADLGREKYDELKVLNNPLLTIGAFTQPNVLKELKAMSGRGLIERFMFSVPQPKYQKGLGIRMSNEVKRQYHKNINKLLKLTVDESENHICLDSTALNEYAELADIAARKKFDYESPEVLKGWYAKLIEKLLKVTTLIHIANEISSFNEVKNFKLGKEEIKKAKKLFSYFEKHAKEALGIVHESVLEIDAKRYLRKIVQVENKKGEVTKTDLQQAFKNEHEWKEREDILNFLCDLNYIQIEKIKQKRVIQLNPKYKKTLD